MKYLFFLLLIPFLINAQIMTNDANTTALWLLEGDGTDETGNFNASTTTGTVTFETTSKCTRAGLGSNDNRYQVAGGIANLTTAGSIEAIVRRVGTTNGNYDIFIHYAANNRLYLRYSGTTGVLSVSIANVSGANAVGLIAADGNYHYVAMTWHSTNGVDTTYDVWLDGVKKVDGADFGATPGGVNLTATAYYIGYTSSLAHYVDEIRLSNKERSDAEIAAVYARFLSYSGCPETKKHGYDGNGGFGNYLR